ncbi:MAG: hypothetical protein AB8B91_24810 [Rubripirellula sp.]
MIPSIRCISLGTALAFVLSVTPNAEAQLPSVVQLPSFQTFSYSGTVVVPDGGSAYLGGVRRSASGSSRRGLSRAFGSSVRNSGASVRATIIDNDAIDRKLLGGTPEQFIRSNRGRPNQAIDKTEEGKSLVRYARSKYKEGDQSASFGAYQLAIGVLDGRLKELATVEFRRVFGTAAEQSLKLASLHR